MGIIHGISSTISKTNEYELTKIWTYFTQLDVEKNLVIQNPQKTIKINGIEHAIHTFNVKTDIYGVLSYLDIHYEEMILANPTIQEKIHLIHDNLWILDSNDKEEHLTTNYFTQVIEWTEEIKERLNAKVEMGQYQHLTELKALFKGEKKLMINQRYGYYLENKEKKMFRGIQVQAEKGKEILAPLTGKITANEDSIMIQSSCRQLVIKNVSPINLRGKMVKTGEVIGIVAKENELVIEYSKKEQLLNPSFYFEEIEYLPPFALEEWQPSLFDENIFRQMILLNCHAFSDKAEKILAEANKNGISPIIFAAIMIHESAWGTSAGIIEKNNPAGLMNDQGLIAYRTLDEGIEATGRTLKNLIIDRELNTVEKLGTVYCPINATNDPLGLNHYWVPMIKQLMVQLGGTPDMALINSNHADLTTVILAKARSLHQKGIPYSQGNQRGVFPYHDCSSFVFWTMNEAGLNLPLGNTETLYSLEGSVLVPISYAEVKAGDLFVWGEKGNSAGDYGHTGFFLDKEGKTIIHCTPATEKGFGQMGDVVIIPFEGYYGDPQLAPIYFYRIIRR